MKLTRLEPIFNRLKRQILSRVILVRILIIFTILVSIVGLVLTLKKSSTSPAQIISSLSLDSLPQHSGRTNFLILGIPGGSHEGADLTDSLVFLSISHSEKPTVLLSIPRDIWIPSLRAKINSAYHYGRLKADTAGGLLLAKSSVSEIIGQPIDFIAVFDFSTFSQAIDILGGINVQVDASFTDDRYPIAGREQDECNGDPEYACRYETITFSRGSQLMDGNTALKFVRSRHSASLAEGTDFARSRRQARVLEAIKTKILSPQTIRHPSTYKQLLDLVLQNTQTDIDSSRYPTLLRLGLSAKDNPLVSTALSEPDYLYHPPVSKKYDNQWVLVPKNDNPAVVHDYVQSILK